MDAIRLLLLDEGRKKAAETYADKVLATQSDDLIAYWPLWEASDTTIKEQIGIGDGTYVGVTLGEPGIGDGNTCPFYDGTNDSGNIATVSLFSAFNGLAGSFMVWIKVYDAGVWKDSTLRRILTFRDGSTEYIMLDKDTTDDTLYIAHRGSAVYRQIATTAYPLTTFMCVIGTWSDADDELYLYVNNNQIGPTTSLGAWTSTINASVLGDVGAKWYGWLAHAALWDAVLTEEARTALLTV